MVAVVSLGRRRREEGRSSVSFVTRVFLDGVLGRIVVGCACGTTSELDLASGKVLPCWYSGGDRIETDNSLIPAVRVGLLW